MASPIIEVQDLSFKYDQRNNENILTDISFSIQQGDWVAILGNNGSGKSTLAKLLVGLLSPQAGQIMIAGNPLTEETKWEIRQHIALVFQNPENQFIGTSVEEDVAFGLENQNIPFSMMKTKVDEVLDLVGMTPFRKADPSRLSGGQKQRVAIASVLALDPDIIVLDEALVMLDPKSKREILATLTQIQMTKQTTILSITHDMDEAMFADQIILLENGRIKQIGTPTEVFSKITHLEPPFVEKLRRTLQQKKRQVPEMFLTEDEMVKWLCK